MNKLYLQVILSQLDIFAGIVFIVALLILSYTLIAITTKITNCINKFSEAKILENKTKQKHLNKIDSLLKIIEKIVKNTNSDD